MNTYLLVLKGTNKHLAIKEFSSFFSCFFKENVQLHHVLSTLFSFSTSKDIQRNIDVFQRLTFTNECYQLLWEGSTYEDFYETMELLSFQELEDKSFAIREKHFGFSPFCAVRELAKPIWVQLKNPKVDLTHPDVEFSLFSSSNSQKYFGKLLFRNSKEYLQRMPKIRPVAKPYTLKSDMARACCNLLGLQPGAKVIDPFCGIGGILLEMLDLGYETYGNDISAWDLELAKQNISHYFPEKTYTLTESDVKNLPFEDDFFDGMVTDIPYGKSCRRAGNDVYESFLQEAQRTLKNNAKLIVIYANFLDFKELVSNYFQIEDEIDQYINASMTRHILILRK
jgi:tRNA (guanine10-N2)-dimethyltransferase